VSPDRPIALAAPDIGEREIAAVVDVLRSRSLALGPVTERFEEAMAARFGARYGVAVSSGTAALHLAMIAAGVRDGDLAVTTPMSFVASANAILYERGIPVFADVDPVTLTLDPGGALEAMDALVHQRRGWRQLLPRTCNPTTGNLRALVPVHVFGRPTEMGELVPAARELGIPIVEDACESIGATADGVDAGRWGEASVFGFYPNKQITSGEGGMILTDDEAWARLFRSLRNQGRSDGTLWLRHDRLGYNYRLDEMSSALALVQLARLDELLRARAAVAERYAAGLAPLDGVSLLAPPRPGMSVSWFVYAVRLAPDVDRDLLMSRLAARGVACRPYFWPIHLQPFYRERFGYRPGDFPAAEAAGRALLALPFSSVLPPEDVDHVCDVFAQELARARGSAVPVAMAGVW
jgi:dTDP-4-amino-4,6-dideoxygalactose transaminase